MSETRANGTKLDGASWLGWAIWAKGLFPWCTTLWLWYTNSMTKTQSSWRSSLLKIIPFIVEGHEQWATGGSDQKMLSLPWFTVFCANACAIYYRNESFIGGNARRDVTKHIIHFSLSCHSLTLHPLHNNLGLQLAPTHLCLLSLHVCMLSFIFGIEQHHLIWPHQAPAQTLSQSSALLLIELHSKGRPSQSFIFARKLPWKYRPVVVWEKSAINT